VTWVVIVGIALLDVVAVGAVLYLAVRRSTMWPEPHLRQYACDRCRRTYRDVRTLSMHVQAEHPDTFDGS
jgi:hypothetical protein